MTFIRSGILCICCMVFLLPYTGCRSILPIASNNPPEINEPASLSSPENHILVFFIRHANFSGGGRTHLLKVDDKLIGPLTADNYYRLEMWPGQYQFSISLPREEFFGWVSPPSSIGRQLTLKHHLSGHAFLCSYTDGTGSSGFSLEPIAGFPAYLNDRRLAKIVSARDTAQVTQLFDARYDGPAMHGRAHAEGTLTWPDGAVYKGTFVHGVPTRKARFIFPDGKIFMGPNHKGRPAKTGLLMTDSGRILFAGHFVDEKPNGVGLRSGPEGPEFCIFDHGRDMTKSFRQLAKEALDIEDRQRIKTFSNCVEDITAKIESLKTRLRDLASRHDPDMVRTGFSQLQKEIKKLEKKKRYFEANMVSETEAFIKQLRQSRYLREISKAKAFRKQHQAKIEKEHRWCRDEFAQGRNLCTCAPLADDFHQWQECWEPLRKKYID